MMQTSSTCWRWAIAEAVMLTVGGGGSLRQKHSSVWISLSHLPVENAPLVPIANIKVKHAWEAEFPSACHISKNNASSLESRLIRACHGARPQEPPLHPGRRNQSCLLVNDPSSAAWCLSVVITAQRRCQKLTPYRQFTSSSLFCRWWEKDEHSSIFWCIGADYFGPCGVCSDAGGILNNSAASASPTCSSGSMSRRFDAQTCHCCLLLPFCLLFSDDDAGTAFSYSLICSHMLFLTAC